MSFISVLSEKSWLPNNEVAPVKVDQDPARTALRFFLAVVGVIFFLFTITFITRTTIPDFQALAGEPWQPFTEPRQLWLNTLLLFLSSVCLHSSLIAARKSRQQLALVSLLLAVAFALAFIVGQIMVWQDLWQLGYYMSNHPAASYFYLFTFIHGLHLLGGLFALFIVVVKFSRGQPLEATAKSLKLCTTYWHFLFALWLLLFGLLTASPETYSVIAELCGF